jgi:hypothetical protein
MKRTGDFYFPAHHLNLDTWYHQKP